jgi:hypothetical protein
MPDCPGHKSPAGGCPDPEGHLLRCEYCSHIPLGITYVTDHGHDGLPLEGKWTVATCEACGAVTEMPPEYLKVVR